MAKFEKAEKDAKIKERKEKLGEFAKDMSDEDILDDAKYEMAQKDKKIAELESTVEKATKKLGADFTKGSADKEPLSDEETSRNKVNDYAWKSRYQKDKKTTE